MILKEMSYSRNGDICEVLAEGEYKGHKYVVRSYGTHPCAYVSVAGKKAINTDDIICHGEVTYYKDHLPMSEASDDIWWIGWDYAHSGDRLGWHEYFPHCEKSWTTKEIEQECLKVIDQLEELYGSNV